MYSLLNRPLWLIVFAVSCSTIVAPKKETTQVSESHLYKLPFKKTSTELKTLLHSLGIPVEKVTEEEGKGQIITQWTSTKGAYYPIEQRFVIEYRYENPEYTFIKITSDLQMQTPWEGHLKGSFLDKIEKKEKELAYLEEKRRKLEILELDYQKEKEKLENELKELEQKRKRKIFERTAEEDLKYLFVSKLESQFEVYDPTKSWSQRKVIQEIFSLAERAYEKRDDTSTKPEDVLAKKDLFWTLWKLAEEHRQVIPKITRALEDKDSKTRLKAAIALLAMGREPMTPPMIKGARQALQKALNDPDPEVRAYSEKALKRLVKEY